MPSSVQIRQILSDMRSAIDDGKFTHIDRYKNQNTLARLGIDWVSAKEEIYDLTEEDYYSGPEIDRKYPDGDFLWIFKKNVLGQIIYIKFKILYQENNEVKVLSFHIDGE